MTRMKSGAAVFAGSAVEEEGSKEEAGRVEVAEEAVGAQRVACTSSREGIVRCRR